MREGCGRAFKSINPAARYCSLTCFNLDSRTVVERECQQCCKAFRPVNNKSASRFCSVECTNESFRRVEVYARCECCGTSFIAGNTLAKYCSTACKKAHKRFQQPGYRPTRFTPRLFDYVFRRAA